MTSVFSWSDVTYSVKKKDILKGISGELSGGKVCAILGPSGAGKTSLLNVLANRIRNKGANQRVGGTIKLDGRELVGGALRKRIAYVMQQDLLFATQTPREALLFSAMMRLPSTVPLSEKRAMVEQMLADLGLMDCADTFCGDDMIRGISGGEKKRTSIGIELVMRPNLIFLDEPTSGLDSFAAKIVIAKLVELASSNGCNVLTTIHQPSSEVFHTFNNVMLLYHGKSLFFGSLTGLSGGLIENGVGCPNEYNLADHAIYLIQTTNEDKLDALKIALEKGAKDTHVGATPPVSVVVEEAHDAKKKTYPGAGDDSTHNGHVSGPGVGFLFQLYILSQREAKYVWRNKPALIASIVVPLILNLFFAGIFGGSGDPTSDDYSLQGHFGGIAQVMIGAMFGAAQPLLLRFPLDRGIFLREYATNSYGAIPYFLSKSVVEIPQQFMQALLIYIAFYWISGIQGSFIIHVCILWLTSMAAASTALLVGCLASNAEVAIQASPPVFVVQLLFAGVFIPTSQIPDAFNWIQYICALKYGINLALLNEFGEVTQEAKNWTSAQRAAADSFVENIDVNPNDWYIYLIVLLSLLCFFRGLAIFALAKRASAFF